MRLFRVGSSVNSSLDFKKMILGFCPGGTPENSPAIHRWEQNRISASPGGRLKLLILLTLSRPSGTGMTPLFLPAINRWAILAVSLRDKIQNFFFLNFIVLELEPQRELHLPLKARRGDLTKLTIDLVACGIEASVVIHA